MFVKTVSSCDLNYACEQYVNILRQQLGPYFTRPMKGNECIIQLLLVLLFWDY